MTGLTRASVAMAEDQKSSMMDLEKELSCSICTDVFYQPLTLLDCLHTFCGACLKEWFSCQLQASHTTNTHRYTCPSCRASVLDAKPHATVNALVDIFLQSNPSRGKSKEEKEDQREKYKPGDNVVPKWPRREESGGEYDRRRRERSRENRYGLNDMYSSTSPFSDPAQLSGQIAADQVDDARYYPFLWPTEPLLIFSEYPINEAREISSYEVGISGGGLEEPRDRRRGERSHDNWDWLNTTSVFTFGEPAQLTSGQSVTNQVDADCAVSESTEMSEGFIQMPSTRSVAEGSASGSVMDPTNKDEGLIDHDYSTSSAGMAQAAAYEAESKLARTHPLYQASVKEDDLYHCPREDKPGCAHKPTKLKCNYDKYVDSHLRPFRCKACAGMQFSSTACLLRHERESHGMHCGGSRPHLCTYTDCERSTPGNGFPRRYNLYDHMRRVHDYTSSPSPASQVSPHAQSAPPGVKRPSYRKRTTGQVENTVTKRPK